MAGREACDHITVTRISSKSCRPVTCYQGQIVGQMVDRRSLSTHPRVSDNSNILLYVLYLLMSHIAGITL